MAQKVVLSNFQIVLKQYPTEKYPQVNQSIFELKKSSNLIALDSIPEGFLIIKNIFIGINASMRVWITGIDTYVGGVKKGDTMKARCIGQVLYSKGKLPTKTLVYGGFGWQKYAVVNQKDVFPLPKNYEKPQQLISVYGTEAIAAYFGLHKIGKIKKNQKVVISAAAGSTGSLAVQLAKAHGCIVCGIAGSDQKCQYIKKLGADSTINYKKQSIQDKLKSLYPGGIDVFFDNVGGPTLDAVLMNIRQGSRIALCGSISSYNQFGQKEIYKLKNYPRLIIKKCTMQGFISTDYIQQIPQVQKKIQQLVSRGELKIQTDILDGFQKCPEALRRLLLGQNKGKTIVKISDKDSQLHAKL